jgi:transcriptional regulator with XRE-family HTH domain
MDHKAQARILRQFGSGLKRKRKAKGLSMRALAVVADMDHASINDIEKGKTDLKLLTICKLAEALGVEPADMMKAIKPPVSPT